MAEKDKKMCYINSNYEQFSIPRKIKKYYTDLDDEESLLTIEQCLDVLEYLVYVDYMVYNPIYLENDIFKGIGFFGDIKVAFFGDKYGPTKVAIPYDEFKMFKLSENDISCITRDIKDFFRNSVRWLYVNQD